MQLITLLYSVHTDQIQALLSSISLYPVNFHSSCFNQSPYISSQFMIVRCDTLLKAGCNSTSCFLCFCSVIAVYQVLEAIVHIISSVNISQSTDSSCDNNPCLSLPSCCSMCWGWKTGSCSARYAVNLNECVSQWYQLQWMISVSISPALSMEKTLQNKVQL